MNFLLHFLATLFVFITLDVIWLKFVIDGLVEYPYVIHHGNKPNWALAEIYYVVMSFWIAYGAAYKGMVYNHAFPAFFDGWKAGFRFSVLYVAINTVFLFPWPMELIVMDIAWVTFSTAIAAVASYAIGVWLTSDNKQVKRMQ